MRIFVVEPTGQGGLVHYAYELCTGLSNAGADVTLVTADEYELSGCPHRFRVEKRLRLWKIVDSRAVREESPGIVAKAWRRIWWTGRRVLRFARLLGQWAHLTNYLIAEKPDVVLFGRFYFPGVSVFLRRLKRHGLILADVCHEYEFRDPSLSRINVLIDRTTEFFEKTVYKTFSAVFIHGEINRDRFLAELEAPPERVHIIQHGVSSLFFSQALKVGLAERYGIDASDRVVLFFGNLRVSKGVPDLLRAFALIGSDGYRAKLVIAGYPTQSVDAGELRELARSLGIERRVVFDIRYIPNQEVAELMRLATVVAFPYLSATQSGPLMIAHAFGRPVVATSVGNFPEVVKDGCTGFLVPPASPPALAEALRKILASPDLAGKMGEAAKALAERRYSWNAIAGEIVTVLEKIASGPAAREKTASSSASKVRTAAIDIETVRSEEAFLALASEWNTLLDASGLGNIFLTWEWMSAWWTWFGRGRFKPWVIAARDGSDGRLVGLLPLASHAIDFAGLRLRQLSFMAGDRVIDHLDAIVMPGYAESVIPRFVDSLVGKPVRHDFVRLDAMKSDSAFAKALLDAIGHRPGAGCMATDSVCPYLALPGTWDSYWASIGKQSRYYFSRKAKRLQSRAPGAVSYRKIESKSELADAMREFVRLHQARQRQKGNAGIFAQNRAVGFHAEVAERFLDKGWLRLYLLAAGEKAIAAIYCYTFGGKFSFYQSGYDPAWGDCSPGALIMLHAVREAIEEGADEFDFLRGEEAYKSLWTSAARTDRRLRIALSLPGWAILRGYELAYKGRRAIQANLIRGQRHAKATP